MLCFHACILCVPSRPFANKIIQFYHISEMFDVVIDIKAKTLYVCLEMRQYCLCELWPGKILINTLSYIYHIQ